MSLPPLLQQIRSPMEEAQEPQDSHHTGGSLGVSRPVFSFSACAMFPPHQTFPCDKWKASFKKKKSGKNECSEARADTTSLARGDTLSPGQAGRRGLPEEALQC